MGILANTKQFLKQKMTIAATKVADGIAVASQLSPQQIADIEDKRQKYLAQKPNMTDDQAEKIIRSNLGAIGIEVYQDYLAQLKDFYLPVNLAAVNFDPLNRIRYCDITKWVNSSDEQYIDKLVSVYRVLNGDHCNIALIFHRTKEKCSVTLAIANTDVNQSDPAQADAYLDRIIKALKGNFPGVEIKQKEGKGNFGNGIPESLRSAVKGDSRGPVAKSVAAVSGLASEKSKEFISQSMEKLLDGVGPCDNSEAYTVVLLATPVTNINEKKIHLYNLEEGLSPYETWQASYNYTTNDAQNAAADMGFHLGAQAGVQAGTGHVDGENRKMISNTGDGSREKNPLKGIKHVLLEGVGMLARPSISSSDSNTMGFQAGANFGVQFSRSSSINIQVGKNEGITQTFTNYAVKHALETAEKQIKRLEEGASLGMWEFCAYVISESSKIAADVANNYLSLIQGEESFMTAAAIYLWDGQRERDKALPILESIQSIQHPVFALSSSVNKDDLMYPTLVTPSVCITGRELARAMNFPRKSVSGLPVLEGVAFGREVNSQRRSVETAERKIVMGRIYHMNQAEGTPVTLDVDSLTSHVFITGTTGSGKSNAVYQILDKLREHGVKFLVVEPAKGEYKKILGGICHVYGTNPNLSDLLCINPFSFPEKISVTEHIDKLIEILNACWPMYAAMPAILKDAVERSYEKVGWNLNWDSCSPRRFPTFADLIETLPEVISSSFYSGDTKNDYAGALVTRVRSLTNGVAGQIFCRKQELTYEDLFENDVIIDLSRVSNSETKSLIMGIIVMKDRKSVV